VNRGETSRVAKFFELAGDIESAVDEMMLALYQICSTLDKLSKLYPESLDE